MAKRLYYMREHSNIVRKFSHHKNYNDDDAVIKPTIPIKQTVLIILCRKKQRLLSQAWEKWTNATDVFHDYTVDVRIILSRSRLEDEQLDELETEVLYKWVLQNYHADPTGIAHALKCCKSKAAVVSALQSMRLEQFEPGEGILYQNTWPKSEDGLFTILSGACDVMLHPAASMSVLTLGTHVKNKDWEGAKAELCNARLINTMNAPSGFGELASLALIKRTASVRAQPDQDILTELLIITRKSLYTVLSASMGNSGVDSDVQSASEAIDFLRQTGLGVSMSSRDLFSIASCMRKRTVRGGSVLYITEQPADCIYLVVNGEVIADTEYSPESLSYPFIGSSPTNCYIMSNGSMLGDEAFLGTGKDQGHFYQSTVAVISDTAVIFEIAGYGLEFLVEKLNGSRYSALAYKELSPWSVPITQADSNCIYTMFNSLRKCISESNPNRGTVVAKPKKGSTMKIEDLGLPKENSLRVSTGSASRVSSHGSRGRNSPKKATSYGMRRSSPQSAKSRSLSQCERDDMSTPWHQQSLGESSTHTIQGHSTTSSHMSDEVDVKTFAELPVTVMQYALKLRRDHIREESKKIRIQAKDNILHHELKKHGMMNAQSKFVSEKIEKTQRQLHHNVDSYQRRCIANKKADIEASHVVNSNSVHPHVKLYGVDFEVVSVESSDDDSEVDIEDEACGKARKIKGAGEKDHSALLSPEMIVTDSVLGNVRHNLLQHYMLVELRKAKYAKVEAEARLTLSNATPLLVPTPQKASGVNLTAKLKPNRRGSVGAALTEANIQAAIAAADSNVVSLESSLNGSMTEQPVPSSVNMTKLNLALVSAAKTYGVQREVRSNSILKKHGSRSPSTQSLLRSPKISPRNTEAALSTVSSNAAVEIMGVNEEITKNVLLSGSLVRNNRPVPRMLPSQSIRKIIPLKCTFNVETTTNAGQSTTVKSMMQHMKSTHEFEVDEDGTINLTPTVPNSARGDVEVTERASEMAFLNAIESPREFMKLIREKEFPKSKKYVPEKEWSTRFVRINGGTKRKHSNKLLKCKLGGSDGYGNDLGDGMPVLNKSILYQDVMKARVGGASIGSDSPSKVKSRVKAKEVYHDPVTEPDIGPRSIPEAPSALRVANPEDVTESMPRDADPNHDPSPRPVPEAAMNPTLVHVETLEVPVVPLEDNTETGQDTEAFSEAHARAGDNRDEKPNSGAGCRSVIAVTTEETVEGVTVIDGDGAAKGVHSEIVGGADPENGVECLPQPEALTQTKPTSAKKVQEETRSLAQQNPGADALAKLHAAVHTERPSSKYLDGKRNHASKSKFRLILPEEPDDYAVMFAMQRRQQRNQLHALGEDTGSVDKPPHLFAQTVGKQSYTAKSNLALFNTLQAPSSAKPFSRFSMDEMLATNSGLTTNTVARPGASQSATHGHDKRTLSTLKEACYDLHKDAVLADWQEFCVDRVNSSRVGAHKSLPTLNRTFSSDKPEKSGHKSGKLVETPSILEYEPKGPSSYLELCTRKAHSKNKKHIKVHVPNE